MRTVGEAGSPVMTGLADSLETSSEAVGGLSRAAVGPDVLDLEDQVPPAPDRRAECAGLGRQAGFHPLSTTYGERRFKVTEPVVTTASSPLTVEQGAVVEGARAASATDERCGERRGRVRGQETCSISSWTPPLISAQLLSQTRCASRRIPELQVHRLSADAGQRLLSARRDCRPPRRRELPGGAFDEFFSFRPCAFCARATSLHARLVRFVSCRGRVVSLQAAGVGRRQTQARLSKPVTAGTPLPGAATAPLHGSSPGLQSASARQQPSIGAWPQPPCPSAASSVHGLPSSQRPPATLWVHPRAASHPWIVIASPSSQAIAWPPTQRLAAHEAPRRASGSSRGS